MGSINNQEAPQFPNRRIHTLGINPDRKQITALIEVVIKDSADAKSACQMCRVSRMVGDPTHCTGVAGGDSTLAFLVVGLGQTHWVSNVPCNPLPDLKELANVQINLTDQVKEFARRLVNS